MGGDAFIDLDAGGHEVLVARLPGRAVPDVRCRWHGQRERPVAGPLPEPRSLLPDGRARRGRRRCAPRVGGRRRGRSLRLARPPHALDARDAADRPRTRRSDPRLDHPDHRRRSRPSRSPSCRGGWRRRRAHRGSRPGWSPPSSVRSVPRSAVGEPVSSWPWSSSPRSPRSRSGLWQTWSLPAETGPPFIEWLLPLSATVVAAAATVPRWSVFIVRSATIVAARAVGGVDGGPPRRARSRRSCRPRHRSGSIGARRPRWACSPLVGVYAAGVSVVRLMYPSTICGTRRRGNRHRRWLTAALCDRVATRSVVATFRRRRERRRARLVRRPLRR